MMKNILPYRINYFVHYIHERAACRLRQLSQSPQSLRLKLVSHAHFTRGAFLFAVVSLYYIEFPIDYFHELLYS